MSSLRLSKTSARKLETYASRTGKSASAVANEAINFWYEVQGEIALEELDRGVPPERRLIDHPLFG
jgi:hypothetical protein